MSKKWYGDHKEPSWGHVTMPPLPPPPQHFTCTAQAEKILSSQLQCSRSAHEEKEEEVEEKQTCGSPAELPKWIIVAGWMWNRALQNRGVHILCKLSLNNLMSCVLRHKRLFFCFLLLTNPTPRQFNLWAVCESFFIFSYKKKQITGPSQKKTCAHKNCRRFFQFVFSFFMAIIHIENNNLFRLNLCGLPRFLIPVKSRADPNVLPQSFNHCHGNQGTNLYLKQNPCA